VSTDSSPPAAQAEPPQSLAPESLPPESLPPESLPPISLPPRLAQRRRALLVLLAALLGLWTVWATAILPHLTPLEGPLQTVRSVGIRILLWIVPCAIYARSQGLRMTLIPWYFQLPPSAKHWALAIGTTLAAGVAVSFDVARKLGVTPWEVWVLFGQRLTPTLPIPEFFEELVFRGILLSELLCVIPARKPALTAGDPHAPVTDRSRFWLANLAASLVFTGLHWPWWIYSEGFTEAFLLKTGGVFLISLVLGMLFVRSRSLWPAVALHWLNNALSSLAG
jgi:membrane protease YdiL (CAAX protease family)